MRRDGFQIDGQGLCSTGEVESQSGQLEGQACVKLLLFRGLALRWDGTCASSGLLQLTVDGPALTTEPDDKSRNWRVD